MNIPKKFKLFNTTYTVVFDNEKMDDRNAYGVSDYSASKIILSTKDGINDLSIDRIADTFYHELTHAILDMMHERELSKNEKFVDVFGKLMRQAIDTAEFERDE